jgi:hypothetical protein
MKSLFNVVQAGINFIASFGITIVQAVWDVVLSVLDALLALFLLVVGLLVELLVLAAVKVVEFFVLALPDFTANNSVELSPLAMANHYVPISEIIALIGTLAVLGAVIGVVKVYKLIPFKAT